MSHTVETLKIMAKQQGIVGISKMRKAELEAALGLPITGKPPSARKPTVVRPVAAAPSPVREKVGDLLLVVRLGDYQGENEAIGNYLVPFKDVRDRKKLLAEISKPIEQREMVDVEAGIDYVQKMMEGLETFPSGEVKAVPQGQQVTFTVIWDCRVDVPDAAVAEPVVMTKAGTEASASVKVSTKASANVSTGVSTKVSTEVDPGTEDGDEAEAEMDAEVE